MTHTKKYPNMALRDGKEDDVTWFEKFISGKIRPSLTNTKCNKKINDKL